MYSTGLRDGPATTKSIDRVRTFIVFTDIAVPAMLVYKLTSSGRTDSRHYCQSKNQS
jgi:hypothetical protein